MRFDIGPYDPCPCGSGAKYKFCCAAKAKDKRHGKYPMGTVAWYGPDDKTPTKIAAGVFRDATTVEPIIERWVSTTIGNDPVIAEQVRKFFAQHGVKTVVVSDGILGCPHEEGMDFPEGEDCPLCPFWAGKQGSAQRGPEPDLEATEYDGSAGDQDEDDEEEYEDDEEYEDEEDDEEFLLQADIDDDEREGRLAMILGGDDIREFVLARGRLLAHLQANLRFPCEVTGNQEFQWEERYSEGEWDIGEHQRLIETQPSHTQSYQLLSINGDDWSKWMMFPAEDIAARVRRISDGREFVLGLCELEVAEEDSPNTQLLDDYSYWFVNYR